MTGLILAAAGHGSRFGSRLPKQFTCWRGKALVLHSLERFAPLVDQLVLVLPPDRLDALEKKIENLPCPLRVVAGGARRQDSVANGFRHLSDGVRTVLVHDAARPFVSVALIERLLEAARQREAVVPALPVSDTIKECRGGQVVRTLEREVLYQVQTPQCFRRDVLGEALERARSDGFCGTDEASLVERLGITVWVIEGEPSNRKVTWREDLF